MIISAVLGRRSFLGGTARMEARSRHNGQKGPEWATLPESKQHTQQIREVFRKKLTLTLTLALTLTLTLTLAPTLNVTRCART